MESQRYQERAFRLFNQVLTSTVVSSSIVVRSLLNIVLL
jgi:hypothetical protein